MTYYPRVRTALLIILLQVSFQPLLHASADTDSLLRYPTLVVPGAIVEKAPSGVFLDSRTITYLVTARHVFVNDTSGLVKPSALVRGNASNQNEHQGYVLELDLDVLQRSDNWKEDLEHDVLVVRLMRDSKLMERVQVKYEPTSGPAKVPFSSLLALRQIAMQKATWLDTGVRIFQKVQTDPNLIFQRSERERLFSRTSRKARLFLTTLLLGATVARQFSCLMVTQVEMPPS